MAGSGRCRFFPAFASIPLRAFDDWLSVRETITAASLWLYAAPLRSLPRQTNHLVLQRLICIALPLMMRVFLCRRSVWLSGGEAGRGLILQW